jgi:predicted lipoprotein with Yx(FWY)xxD motif
MAARSAVPLVFALVVASCADATIPRDPRTTDPVLGVGSRGALGDVITADGMTVYVYTKDRRDESVCYGICAMDWPPLLVTRTPTLATALPGRLGTVVRGDGTKQLTYDHRPLYLYIEDPPRTDQANGEDVDHEWFVVHP